MVETSQSKYSTLFSPQVIYRQWTWTLGDHNNVNSELDDDDDKLILRKGHIVSGKISSRRDCFPSYEFKKCSKGDRYQKRLFSSSLSELEDNKQQSTCLNENSANDDPNNYYLNWMYNGKSMDTICNRKFDTIVKGIQYSSSHVHLSVEGSDRKINGQESLKIPTVLTRTKIKHKKPDFERTEQSLKPSNLKRKITKFVEVKCSPKKVKEKISLRLFHRNRNSVDTSTSLNKSCNQQTKEVTDHRPFNIYKNNSKSSYDCINKDLEKCAKTSKTSINVNTERKKQNIISVSPCKRTKIYYSERQSEMKNGAPSVPPCTPAYFQYDTVDSLADLKSQRKVIQRLIKLESRQREKEKMILKKAKEQEEKRKAEELDQLIEKQRRQIYYLNEIMTKYENERFLEYKEKHSGAPV